MIILDGKCLTKTCSESIIQLIMDIIHLIIVVYSQVLLWICNTLERYPVM